MLRGIVEFAPFDGNPVFRPFELRLQIQEVLVGFQVGITLGDSHQPTERRRKLALRLIETGHSGGIVHVDPGLRRFRTRFDYLFQRILFVGGVTLYGAHQIRNQVGATLILILNVAQLRRSGFAAADHIVVTSFQP